jgi:hypothetical protein
MASMKAGAVHLRTLPKSPREQNNRPRKSLGFRALAEVMAQQLRELSAVLRFKLETALTPR